MNKFIGVLGIFTFLGIAFLFSNNKKSINWRLVAIGLSIQSSFALLVLKVPMGQIFFAKLGNMVDKLLEFTNEGTHFIFGNLIGNNSIGFVFAFQVLPTIIFFSALMEILYYLGVMQLIINIISKGLSRLLQTSGAETVSAVSNIFLSQNEAPLIIKPYIGKMTNSELFAVMVGGMSTVAGSVMAGYVALGVNASHLLAASVMAAPAGIVIAKIMIPEVDEPVTKSGISLKKERTANNMIEAASNGAIEGIQIALNVGGLLIAFVALISLFNYLLSTLGGIFGMQFLSLNWIFGKLFSPVAYLMGIPFHDIATAGNLLGEKIILNEFVAYGDLSTLINSNAISEKTILIMTYALCGFANFGSIAIQLGSIGSIAPEKRATVATLGLKAVLAGTLSAFLTATIAGLLL